MTTMAVSTQCEQIVKFDTGVPAFVIGEAAHWFSIEHAADGINLIPRGRLERRCTIKPMAIFEHDRGFVEASTTMGQLVFPRGADAAMIYRPFTRDASRHPMALAFPVETMPLDQLPFSPERWANAATVARRLLSKAGIAWNGFSRDDIEQLFRFVQHPDPIEACVLDALVQWRHAEGSCVMEIGSLQGCSLSVIALALQRAESDNLILSVDPHQEYPFNRDYVHLSLRQIGQADRLVQIPCNSDEAHHILRKGMASFVLIDGDHAYEQVVADFNNYKDLLAPNGIIAFHDYGCEPHHGVPEAHPGVRKAVDELVFNDPEFKPLVLAHTLMAFLKRNR